ncbi:hypothetical protein, partial [uncultured Bacteroides sp.]|uniref:hypothetical protein n=1 Tax=uncultured Bacteroides sp. TaxID=162156 RepID=UPI00261F7FF3
IFIGKKRMRIRVLCKVSLFRNKGAGAGVSKTAVLLSFCHETGAGAGVQNTCVLRTFRFVRRGVRRTYAGCIYTSRLFPVVLPHLQCD